MKHGRTVMILIIGVVFFYLIFSMTRYGEGFNDRQMNSIEKIIDKALVQCYALEGSYPTTVEYVEKYGVIFDDKNFVYYYEWFGANIKPTVMVIQR